MVARTFALTPGKRVLFLTKDPAMIARQLAGELDLTIDDVRVEDLLDDINTDTMTPAWVCFDHDPAVIAKNAYADLIVDGQRVFPEDALREGGFEVIVSGQRKGGGSSRETAAQAEFYSGIRLAIAASFSPIHARNNLNIRRAARARAGGKGVVDALGVGLGQHLDDGRHQAVGQELALRAGGQVLEAAPPLAREVGASAPTHADQEVTSGGTSFGLRPAP